ncbi:MAG: PcfJ domain-containing protein [Deltaproteobacteria bacterium]|nr:PcfJ domain-containing protein [Deltaproteobacteria bacterium]
MDESAGTGRVLVHCFDGGLRLEASKQTHVQIELIADAWRVVRHGKGAGVSVHPATRMGVARLCGKMGGHFERCLGSARLGSQPELFALSSVRSAPAKLYQVLPELLMEAARGAARRLDERMPEVEAAVAVDQPTPLVLSHAVASRRYLLADILRFPAAAIAVARVETLPHPGVPEPSPAKLAERLDDWRGLFSPTGRPTRSLQRTLASLPPDTPADRLWALRTLHLERPVASPLHLHLLTERTACARGPAAVRDAQLRMIERASAEELATAIDESSDLFINDGDDTDEDLDERVHLYAELISRVEEITGGGIGGLTRAALRWRRRRPRPQTVAAAHSSSATAIRMPCMARPPIALPTVAGVSFLEDEESVLEEGRRMRHCIGSYVQDACEGKAFLFHIEHRDTHASAEVSATGALVQAVGPRNVENAASRFARRVLTEWGAGFWAVRVGGTETKVAAGRGPVLLDGERLLETVGECVALAQVLVAGSGEPGPGLQGPSHTRVASWFVEHAAAGARGTLWMVRVPGKAGSAGVMALTAGGEIVDTLGRVKDAAQRRQQGLNAAPPQPSTETGFAMIRASIERGAPRAQK